LSRVKGTEGVGCITVFKQRVFDCGAMNRTQQRSTQYTGNAHHVEGVECPVVETLEEQNRCYPPKCQCQGRIPIKDFTAAAFEAINANAPCKATNAHNPPNWNQRVKFHCASGPQKIAMSVPCYLRRAHGNCQEVAASR